MTEVRNKGFWNSHWPLLGIVLVLSLGLKAAILLSPAGDGVINRDGVLYLSAAQLLQEGSVQESLKIYPMPLYPAAIALIQWVIRDWILSARVLSAVSLVLLIVPLFFLTRILFDNRSAFWACLLCALAPELNKLTLQVIRDPLFLLVFTCAVYFAVKSMASKRSIDLTLTVVFSWTAVVLRIEGLALIALHPLFLLAMGIRNREDRAYAIKGLLGWAASALFLILFAYLWVGPQIGSLNRFGETAERISGWISGDFLEGYQQIRSQLSDLESRSPVSFARQNFAEIARHFIWLIYLVGLLENVVIALTPAGILSLFWTRRTGAKAGALFLGLLTGGMFLGLYLHLVEMDFLEPRFLLPVAVLLFPWCGAGVSNLVSKLKLKTKATVLPIILAFFLVPSLYDHFRIFRSGENAVREVGLWLSGYLSERTGPVLTTDLRIPFYAGRPVFTNDGGGVVLLRRPDDDYRDIAGYADQLGVETMIIVISAGEPPRLPEGVRYTLIKEFGSDRKRILIYERR
jgi:Dolichyl-phosphate-mannose-protein mannosyltransferase